MSSRSLGVAHLIEKDWSQALRNLDRAKKNLQREYNPEASMWVSYTEHLEDYEGTEREAAPPPPFRSHHYTVAC